ncbi:MAG: Lysine exporter protein [Gammaproteobacteria bacterium]|jgi:RhtB (resistance to homoserine/threonine) family protein|nr:Lysine exporter protein [Gammaproteobacteria bacterium]
MAEFFGTTLVILLMSISPGPDFAMVTKNSLLYSRKAGIFTALGVSCSLLIHASYCILGLAIVISKSLLAFSIIKYVGAAYLAYIGIKAILTKRQTNDLAEESSSSELSSTQAFRQGLLCNLLNPKAILFMLALFTVIVKPSTGLPVQAAYGLEMGLIAFSWFTALSIMISHPYIRTALNKVQYYVTKLIGAVLVGFAISIAKLHQNIGL